MRYLAVVLVLAIGGLSAGCFSTGAEGKDREVVDRQQQHYVVTQPIPFFDYSLDRDVMIQLYTARNQARATYSVVTSMQGDVLFECPSIGFGIPYDVQLTNPLRVYNGNYSDSSVIEQAEPNGLFSSKNTDATFVLCVQEDGKVAPVYSEQKLTVFPFAVAKQADGSYAKVKDAPSSFEIQLQR